MHKRLPLILVVTVALTGCAGGGAGPIGLGAVLGDRNLAAAEPLFDKTEERCLDSANELFAAVFQTTNTTTEKETRQGTKCGKLFSAIRAVIPDRSTETSRSGISPAPYSTVQRNEIIDGLLATSNRKCGRYTAFLKNADGAANASLSLGAILTGGLGSFVGGQGAAKALSGTAAILTGSRAAINEVYLTNQTIHVLAAAFEKARQKQRAVITNRQACPIDQYTLMRGIEDAFKYHSSCSLVTGLEETVLAVERSDAPGLDAMRKTLAEYAMLVRQAEEIGKDGTPTPIAGAAKPLDLSQVIDLDKKITEARAKTTAAQQNVDAKKVALDAAAKAAAAEVDETKRVTLVATRDKLQGEYDKLVALQNEAAWKQEGMTRELQRATQRLASVATQATLDVAPETRVCPFSVTRSS
jgi:hypothetical protein